MLVDFSNYGSTGVHAVVASGGFTFTPAAGTIAVAANGTNCLPTCAANGSTALAVGRVGLNPPSVAPVTMTTALYASFRLTGLDYAELSNNFINGWSASSIEVTGMLLGGGTVSQTLSLDGINDGPGGGTDFETAVLAGFWSTSDLVSLQFAGFIGADDNQAFQLDNIALDVTRVSQLPEPGSLALGGLALAAAWQTRRRAAVARRSN
ncbi:hypothetical protein ASC81_24175 [Pelomonas sp. Root405]|nr:hypothetical protein ASC81_24175 [Pelomonas sp. Root405]